MFSSKFFAAALSVIIISILAGCNKNEVISPNNPSSPKKVLSKLIQDPNNYSDFSYVNGKVAKYENVYNSQISYSATFDYDNEGRPQTGYFNLPYNDDQMKKYFYDSSSRLDSMQFFIKDSNSIYVPMGTVIIFYNSAGELIKWQQINIPNKLIMTFEYEYDVNGNVIDTKAYDANGLYSETVMSYDNKINPLPYTDGEVPISKNNEITGSYSEPRNPEQNYSFKYTYTYDKDGYPLTETYFYTQGSVKDTVAQTYQYQ